MGMNRAKVSPAAHVGPEVRAIIKLKLDSGATIEDTGQSLGGDTVLIPVSFNLISIDMGHTGHQLREVGFKGRDIEAVFEATYDAINQCVVRNILHDMTELKIDPSAAREHDEEGPF